MRNDCIHPAFDVPLQGLRIHCALAIELLLVIVHSIACQVHGRKH